MWQSNKNAQNTCQICALSLLFHSVMTYQKSKKQQQNSLARMHTVHLQKEEHRICDEIGCWWKSKMYSFHLPTFITTSGKKSLLQEEKIHYRRDDSSTYYKEEKGN